MVLCSKDMEKIIAINQLLSRRYGVCWREDKQDRFDQSLSSILGYAVRGTETTVRRDPAAAIKREQPNLSHPYWRKP